MRLYGLIGWPLGHSFSQKFFTEKFAREGVADARYDLFPLENIADLPDLLSKNPDLRGLNVTIPHKETVIPFLDELDETARAVGAVNCLKIENQKLRGFNTDVYGFGSSLINFFQDNDRADFLQENSLHRPWPEEALILGTGGAAKAVAFVLKMLGIAFQFVSRHPAAENQISYKTLHLLPSALCPLIINTTPLGMLPQENTCPDLPFERLSTEHFVCDLVYNPAETLLLRRARERGCAVKNGLEMLHLQAEASWAIWRN
jgi:shikimate dehydrogenase